MRWLAVVDAIAKAKALADLAGVELGELFYMSEGAAWATGGGYDGGLGAYALEAAGAAPPIREGDARHDSA